MSTSITATSSKSTTPASGPSSPAGSTALSSLTGNFQTFLTLLTTQLQNQDPTSPMNANQFTSELVQFAGVEQQINTNSNLSQLISLTQGTATLQSTQLLGRTVEATSDALALQQGSARVNFTASRAGPVAITVRNAAGAAIYTDSVAAATGANAWTWNGRAANGTQMPDGAYAVSVAAIGSDGSATPLPFTILGTATAVRQQGATVTVDLGGLGVNMSKVTAIRD